MAWLLFWIFLIHLKAFGPSLTTSLWTSLWNTMYSTGSFVLSLSWLVDRLIGNWLILIICLDLHINTFYCKYSLCFCSLTFYMLWFVAMIHGMVLFFFTDCIVDLDIECADCFDLWLVADAKGGDCGLLVWFGWSIWFCYVLLYILAMCCSVFWFLMYLLDFMIILFCFLNSCTNNFLGAHTV